MKHEIVAVDDIYALEHFGRADGAIIDLAQFTLRERPLRQGEDTETVLSHLRDAKKHIVAAAKRFVPSGRDIDLTARRTLLKTCGSETHPVRTWTRMRREGAIRLRRLHTTEYVLKAWAAGGPML